MKNHRKTIIALTLVFIICISILPLSVQAKKGPKKQKRWKLPKKGKVETIRINDELTMFREYIPLSPDLAASFTGTPIEYLPDGIYYTVNVFALEIPNPDYDEDSKAKKHDETLVILIDAGDDQLANKLLRAVRKVYNQKPDAVYLTHYHSDHAGGGRYFQKKKIPVYAPYMEFGLIQQGAALPGVPEEFTYKGYTPDHTYPDEDGFITPFDKEPAPGFSIIPAPGHSIGSVHIQYMQGNTRYLFAADTIIPKAMDAVNELDMTYPVTLGAAYQNYLIEIGGGPYPFWTYQKLALNKLTLTAMTYTLVLNGHTPPLSPISAYEYVLITLGTLNNFTPPLP